MIKVSLTIEERLKRIEDELGITERENKKEKYAELVDLYVSYGFSKSLAKGYAHNNMQDGTDAQAAEKKLVLRGATKQNEERTV